NAGSEYSLVKEDVFVERREKEGLTIANEGSLTIALDTNLTTELVEEGIAREFIRHIQNLRKDRNLNVTDRIAIRFHADEKISKAINNWDKIIKEETLATDIKENPDASVTVDVDEVNIKIDIIAILEFV
nr:DUF5915 domain-containing protein [Spirochaetota bacterium]